MGTRRVKRYYRPKDIGLSDIAAVRRILNTQFEANALHGYRLYYSSKELEVDNFDDVSQIFRSKGPARRLSITAKTTGGRYAAFDTTNAHYMCVEFHSSQVNAETQVARIADAVGLRPVNRLIQSAFIAHGFDDKGRRYAHAVGQFLQLLGITVSSGEYFEPTSVSAKIKERIANSDMFVAIVTLQDDRTWIVQETTHADSLGKEPFVLVEMSADHKRGLRGDQEDIFFSDGHISDAFTKILQGLNKLCGTVEH